MHLSCCTPSATVEVECLERGTHFHCTEGRANYVAYSSIAKQFECNCFISRLLLISFWRYSLRLAPQGLADISSGIRRPGLPTLALGGDEGGAKRAKFKEMLMLRIVQMQGQHLRVSAP